MIRTLAIVAALALSLAGCNAAQIAQAPIGQMTVDDARNIIYTLKSSYAATEVVATQYVKLPACEKPAAPPLCSSAPVVRQMVKLRDSARAAIYGGEEVVLNSSASTPLLSAAIAAAQNGYASFKIITETYKK